MQASSLRRHFNPGVSDRPFTFAMSDVGEMVFLPRLLERLRSQAPECSDSVGFHAAARNRRGARERRHRSRDRVLSGSDTEQFLPAAIVHARIRMPAAREPRAAVAPPVAGRLSQRWSTRSCAPEGRSQELFERFLERKGIHRKIVLLTPHFLSSAHDRRALQPRRRPCPHALGVYFSRLSAGPLSRCVFRSEIAGFDLKQHWHRHDHSDSRNQWLRRQVTQLFNDENDEYPRGPGSFRPRSPSSRTRQAAE